AMKSLAESLLKILELQRGIGPEGDLQHAFMRAAGPEEDRVDRVRRGLHADVSEGDGDIVRACRVADDVQDVAAQALGRLEFRPCWRAEPQLEGLDAARRKDLATERH